MSEDTITQRYLDKHRQLPQFMKSEGRKWRWCKLCGAKLEAGDEFRSHMVKHQ